jgi:hypothetical protein
LLIKQEYVAMGSGVLRGQGSSIFGDILRWVREYKLPTITDGHSVNEPVTGLALREVGTDSTRVNQSKREVRAKSDRRIGSGNSKFRLSGRLLNGERRARRDFLAAVDEGEVRFRVEGLEEIGDYVGGIKLGIN